MRTFGWSGAIAAFALSLMLAGCKKDETPSTANSAAPAAGASKDDAAKPPSGPRQHGSAEGPVQGAGSRIGKFIKAPQRLEASSELKNIATFYTARMDEKSPPKSIDDLKGLDPKSIQAVKDSAIVILWNPKPNAPSTAVIAYEKDVPTQGGMVVTLSGVPQRMTPDEFKAAEKVSAPPK